MLLKKPKSNVYISSLFYRRLMFITLLYVKSNVYNSSLCSRRNQKVMFIEETKK